MEAPQHLAPHTRTESHLQDDEKLDVQHVEGTKASDVESQPASEDRVYDAAFQRRTILKIDLRLLIILGLCYSVCLIDRSNLGAARTLGMNVALRLGIGERFSIALLAFFPPYILMELPSMLVLAKLGARIWISCIVVSFGAVTLGMGYVKNWQQLVVLRVLLGATEAGFFPAAAFLISTWYTRREMQTRLAIFYLTSIGLAGLAYVMGYGILTLGGTHGIPSWRWLFIIYGAATIGLGLIAFIVLIDVPEQSKFLTEEQKAFVIDRVNRDRGDAVADKITVASLSKPLKDWKIWSYAFLFLTATTPSYALSYFLPVILNGQGYDVKMSLSLSCPPYICAAIFTLISATLSDRQQNRARYMLINSLVTFVGLMIVAYAPKAGVKYFGAFLIISGGQANGPAFLSYGQAQVRMHSKRSITSVLMVSFGGVGGILASVTYREADYPTYDVGLWFTAALQLVAIVIILFLDRHLKKLNKKADEDPQFLIENYPGFRYSR